MKEMRKK